MVLKVADINMEGVGESQTITNRAQHTTATGHYTVFESQLPESQKKQVLDVTQAMKAMKLNTDLTLS